MCRGRLLTEIAGSFFDLDNKAHLATPRRREIRRLVINMSLRAAEICEHAEKKRFDRMDTSLKNLMVAMAYMACACGSSLRDVAEANIKKLKRRYPDGFDPEISMGRYEIH